MKESEKKKKRDSSTPRELLLKKVKNKTDNAPVNSLTEHSNNRNAAQPNSTREKKASSRPSVLTATNDHQRQQVREPYYPCLKLFRKPPKLLQAAARATIRFELLLLLQFLKRVKFFTRTRIFIIRLALLHDETLCRLCTFFSFFFFFFRARVMSDATGHPLVQPAQIKDVGGEGSQLEQQAPQKMAGERSGSLSDAVAADVSTSGCWKVCETHSYTCLGLFKVEQSALGPREGPWKFAAFQGLKDPSVVLRVVSDDATECLQPCAISAEVAERAALDSTKTWSAEFFVIGTTGKSVRIKAVVTADGDVRSACAIDVESAMYLPNVITSKDEVRFSPRILEMVDVVRANTTGQKSTLKKPVGKLRTPISPAVASPAVASPGPRGTAVKEEPASSLSSKGISQDHNFSTNLKAIETALTKGLFSANKKDKKPLLETLLSEIREQNRRQFEAVKNMQNAVSDVARALKSVSDEVERLSNTVTSLGTQLETVKREQSPVHIVNANVGSVQMQKGKKTGTKEKRRLDDDEVEEAEKFRCMSCGVVDSDPRCFRCGVFRISGNRLPPVNQEVEEERKTKKGKQ